MYPSNSSHTNRLLIYCIYFFTTFLHVIHIQLLGAKIGTNVCLYPNGGDPMMTEPDMVTIGDDASIDDASLIAHINTRGIFR